MKPGGAILHRNRIGEERVQRSPSVRDRSLDWQLSDWTLSLACSGAFNPLDLRDSSIGPEIIHQKAQCGAGKNLVGTGQKTLAC